ncbi:MAG TPA: hypothetical protein VEK80_03725 [Kribbellaceae bacterium]|nr:hypothetical protein [Kribbellaceae bacterium]
MAEPVVFRPSSAARAVAVVAFPALSVITVLLGVGAVLMLSPITGMTLFIICQLLALVPVAILALTLRTWFELRLDDHGLTVSGQFGSRSLRLPWADLAAVGLVGLRGSQLLAVRPVVPWRRSPRWALGWDRECGLLTIGGLDNWDAPRDRVLATIQAYAGPLWSDRLDDDHRRTHA